MMALSFFGPFRVRNVNCILVYAWFSSTKHLSTKNVCLHWSVSLCVRYNFLTFSFVFSFSGSKMTETANKAVGFEEISIPVPWGHISGMYIFD